MKDVVFIDLDYWLKHVCLIDIASDTYRFVHGLALGRHPFMCQQFVVQSRVHTVFRHPSFVELPECKETQHVQLVSKELLLYAVVLKLCN